MAQSSVPGLGQPLLELERVDVVCIIGDRVYHASGSPCQKELEGRGDMLSLTEAQAHEVGMEPCGFCIGTQSAETPKPKTG